MVRICDNYMYICSFLETVSNLSDLQEQHLQDYYDKMDAEERYLLEERIRYLCEVEQNTIEDVAESYMAWCTYFAEERKYFLRHDKQYRNHSFAEIDSVYKNSGYMKNYMIGLSLSAYLWNIQRQNLRFFKKYCKLDIHKSGRYLEIGPGHGEYLSTAIDNTKFDHYLAIDISESAVKQTKDFLEYHYKAEPQILDRVEIRNQDFFAMDEREKFDAIVISQVIEHVEQPESFLVKTSQMTNSDALIYISTAINSPFPDHIYHFHNSSEVRALVEKCGFKIISEFQSVADGLTLEKAEKKDYDIVIGFILRNRV